MRILRRFGWVLAVIICFACAGDVISYTGNGGIWANKKNDFISANFVGTDAGLQQALDYAGPGGEVKVTAGRFPINNTILVTYAGVTLSGAGDSTVFINNSVPGDTLFAVFGDNCLLRDFKIDGLAPAATVGQGIMVSAGTGTTIRNVHIKRTPSAAIHVHMGTKNVRVEGCLIDSIGYSGSSNQVGIILHETTETTVIGNTINRTLGHGIWLQPNSVRCNIVGNTIADAGQDGIAADLGNKFVTVSSNIIRYPKSDGITMDADSSWVGGNTISDAPGFGLWSNDAGNGGSWVNNLFSKCGNYAMSIEQGVGKNVAGWLVSGNFAMNTNGISMEIQSNSGGSVSNVQVVGNYFIGSGQNKPIVRITPVGGAPMTNIHVMNNVIKNGVNRGIEVDVVSGSPVLSNIVITDNQIISNGGRGIATKQTGAGSYAYISRNYLKGNGTIIGLTDAESLSTAGWTYYGDPVGKSVSRQSTSETTGDVVFGGNLAQLTNPTTPALTPSSDDNGNIQFRSNGSYQAGLVFRDTLGTAAGGVGTKHKAMWLEANQDLYIMPFPTVRAVSFRSPSDTSETVRIGTTLSVPTSASFTDKITQSGDRMLVVDSLRVGTPSNSSKATFGGTLDAYGKVSALRNFVVTDSMRCDGRSIFGSSVTDTMVLKRGMALKKDGTAGSIILQNTGNIIEMTNAGITVLRASDAAGSIRFQTGGTTARVQVESSGTVNFNATANVIVADSLRVNKGLYVGGEFVQKIQNGTYTPTRSAEANLDANVTMTTAQYVRVGTVCTVSGRFTADPTTTLTATSFEITLPVASNLTAAEDAAGVAQCGITNDSAEVLGVAANDTAKIQWKAVDVTSQTFSYTFTYTVK